MQILCRRLCKETLYSIQISECVKPKIMKERFSILGKKKLLKLLGRAKLFKQNENAKKLAELAVKLIQRYSIFKSDK